MSLQPDHELEELEDDSRIPPRPEEVIADATQHDTAEAEQGAQPEADGPADPQGPET